jgi:hypothetical protein
MGLISQLGHLRPGCASSESTYVRYAAENGNKFRVFVASNAAYGLVSAIP